MNRRVFLGGIVAASVGVRLPAARAVPADPEMWDSDVLQPDDAGRMGWFRIEGGRFTLVRHARHGDPWCGPMALLEASR